jgi:predicted deacylase
MNRVWSGKVNGTISQQIVYNLYEQAVKYAQYVIDLHTASSTTLLHVVYSAGDKVSRQMAEVFALEVLLEETVSEDAKQARFSGKLRNVLTANGVGAITPELGGDGRFEEENIQKGVRGVTNIMKYLGMLEGEIIPPDNPQVTVRGSHLDKVRANHGGIWQPEIKPGDEVREGQALGYIYSVRSFEVIERFVAPYHGFILGITDVPVVNVGDPIVNICPL